MRPRKLPADQHNVHVRMSDAHLERVDALASTLDSLARFGESKSSEVFSRSDAIRVAVDFADAVLKGALGVMVMDGSGEVEVGGVIINASDILNRGECSQPSSAVRSTKRMVRLTLTPGMIADLRELCDLTVARDKIDAPADPIGETITGILACQVPRLLSTAKGGAR